MADQEHLDILRQGAQIWNKWRQEHPSIQPNFQGADLSSTTLVIAQIIGANLREATLNNAILQDVNISGSDLTKAKLIGANLTRAICNSTNLSGANLTKANFTEATLRGAKLKDAVLKNAVLVEANLTAADLTSADLTDASLQGATLVEANLTKVILTGCKVYGISVWDVHLEGAIQNNLVITFGNQSILTTDNLEVAQFIYLLLNNQKIRDVIDTITSKVVLILGRFTPERKRVLDALREELRKKDYLPIVFDFDVPTNRNVTETVTTLARLSRFIIADITDPKSIPQELAFIVPDLPSVPVQPLLHARSKEYGMYDHFKSFPWVLPAHRYTTVDRLLASLREHVIEPAEKRAKELAIEKAERLKRP